MEYDAAVQEYDEQRAILDGWASISEEAYLALEGSDVWETKSSTIQSGVVIYYARRTMEEQERVDIEFLRNWCQRTGKDPDQYIEARNAQPPSFILYPDGQGASRVRSFLSR